MTEGPVTRNTGRLEHTESRNIFLNGLHSNQTYEIDVVELSIQVS